MIENSEEKKVFKLPPLPEDAIEFGLTDSVDLSDTPTSELTEDAERVLNKEAEASPLSEFISEETENIADRAERDLAIADMVIGDQPVIVDDPMPTPADPDKEFDPASLQNALDDFDEEGGIRKVTAPGATLPTPEKKILTDIDIGDTVSDFNPGTVQNALLNSEIEGGIVSNKSTGSLKTANGDSSSEGRQIKETDKLAESQMYRVYGFTVQYKSVNAAGEKVTITKEVSEFYDKEINAQISVNGRKYLMPAKGGTYDVVNIVSGVPQISHNDQNIYTYTGGKIGAGGCWKRG